MPKFRYSLNSGVNWVVVDAALPFNIPSTASQDVIVEPIGAAVSNLGTVNGNFLSLTYDAANPAASVDAFTNTAGTLYWCFTNSMTPPAGSAIIAGTGFINAGNVGTVPGGLAVTLPSRSGASDIFMHAIVDGVNDTNIATVRVYIGTASAYIAISGTTGSPTITDYTDGDGTWRAYEWTGAGSFTVSAGGGLEYELVAGGGGGGGGINFRRAGGGGAGGVLRGTTTLSPGTYSITVGAGGAGGSTGNSGRSANGGDTTAIGLTAVGGGGGATDNTSSVPPLTGGSGGGGVAVDTNFATGTSGQGNRGGGGRTNSGGGGGGAGGAGGNAADNIGGNGGVGITSTINGTSRGIAGGGAGSGHTGGSSGTATQGGGGAGAPGGNNAGSNGTTAGAGGGGGNGTGTGGSGFRGHFILRVKTA